MEQCLVDPSRKGLNGTHSVKEFCEQLTHVPEWVAKHVSPPPAAHQSDGAGRPGPDGVRPGGGAAPPPMWQAAFAKCFPEFQSTTSLKKTASRTGAKML
ncbi:hypothetical protein CEXT_341511 [Caerostris extrusa]|uniref:Uncharacterized protein n=1 Tax=Caerostris extrusa TaxID=172846 RepID=A0AAV4NE66_CAEEX|nr:hypothetical protein CEXT_341511 [Caerostris extrusa]